MIVSDVMVADLITTWGRSPIDHGLDSRHAPRIDRGGHGCRARRELRADRAGRRRRHQGCSRQGAGPDSIECSQSYS